LGEGTELEKNRKDATENTNGKDNRQKEKEKEEEMQGK
jgi:hypothetical protein